MQNQYVSAVQVRYGGNKGVLVYDPTLKEQDDLINTMIFRESMIKYETTDVLLKLELLDYSKFRAGYLNRQVIILLLSLGVDPNGIREIYQEHVRKVEKGVLIDANIYKYINLDYDSSILQTLSPVSEILRIMTNSKIRVDRDPFSQGIVRTFRTRGYIQLKEKCNILVEKSVRLIGNC